MNVKPVNIFLKMLLLYIGLSCTVLCFSAYSESQTSTAPQVIPDDLSCGKCGMFPARYPQWQSQIIFDDGKMSAFDGCKCMFGFIFNMEKFDPEHKKNNIGNIWVRDFNTGEWTNAKSANYVIGSDVMGPMGKELIPFADKNEATSFQQEHGGQLASFDLITMATLKSLIGKMHMKGKMKMDEHMAQ